METGSSRHSDLIARAPGSRVPHSGRPRIGIGGSKRGGTSRLSPAAGNGIFGCGDRAPKIANQTTPTLAETQVRKSVAGNPRRNALFGVALETLGLQGLYGGVRSQMRTGLRLAIPWYQGVLQGILRLWASETRFSSKLPLRCRHFSGNSLRKL